MVMMVYDGLASRLALGRLNGSVPSLELMGYYVL